MAFTAGGIVTLLAGGLALFGAVLLTGVLLGALVVVAMLMGGVLLRYLGLLWNLGSEAGPYGQGGDDRRGGHRKKARGCHFRGVGVRARRAMASRAGVRP